MAKSSSNYRILVGVELDVSDIQRQLDRIARNIRIRVDSSGLENIADSASEASDGLADAAHAAQIAELTFQAANEVFQTSIDIIGSMVEQVFELDSALTEFRKVSSLSGESLDDYVNQLAEMGAEVGRTTSEMVEASVEFRKNGFNDQDSAQLGQVAAMLQNVADEEISAGESASFIISQMIAFRSELSRFGTEAEKAEHIISAINETSNNFSVSSADLSEALNVVSSTASSFGNSMEETIGMLTAVTEETRNANVSARGLRTIFTNLAQVLDETSSNGKKIAEIFEDLNIAIFDETGQLRDSYDILKDLSEVWNELDVNQRNYIADTIAQTNQINNFLSLMKNFSTATEATEVALNSYGSAARENAAYMESLNKMGLLKRI